MGKLWEKTGEGAEGLKEVDQQTLRVNEPTVVFLSGFLTTDKSPAKVAGGIKTVQNLLKDQPGLSAPPRVLGWTHTSLRNLFNLAAYNCLPSSRSSKAGYDISSAVLMPLVSDDFARQKKSKVSGTPLPLDEVKKRLRNITFFGYSAGGIVGQEVFNATRKMMKKIGYSEADVREALHEVVFVAAGAPSRYSKEANRFTTVSLLATNDRMMRGKNWIWSGAGTLLRTIFTSYGKKKKPMSFRKVSDTSMLINAPVRPTFYEWKYDDEGNRAEKRPFKPLYPKMSFRRSYHELQHYITQDEKNNPFANIISTALANAVTRTERRSPLQLIEAEKPTEHYKQKIAAAASALR